MTADLKRLSDSLRRDTPEETLKQDLASRLQDLRADLVQGRTFRMRDLQGRMISIAPAAAQKGSGTV
jgi:hypothetical protein